MTSSLIILVVIVGLVFWGMSIYNGLVAMRQRVSQAFADIDVQLKQRHDLIPNLVETVKGYADARARDARRRRQGAQRRDRGAGAGRAGRRREHADRRAASAVRACRRPIRTSRPTPTSSNCRPRSPISRTRSPPRAASSTTPCRNTIPGSRASRPCWSRARSASSKREFFDLGETPAAARTGSAGQVLRPISRNAAATTCRRGGALKHGGLWPLYAYPEQSPPLGRAADRPVPSRLSDDLRGVL